MVYFLGIIGGYSQAKVKKNATKQTAAKKKTVTPKADSVVIAPSATREARVAYYRKVQNEYVNIYLSSPLHKDTEKDWMKAFDGIMKTGFRSSLSTNRLHYAFADI